MVAPEHLAKLIGQNTVGDIAQRVTVRGLKLRNAGAEQGGDYSTTDVGGSLPFHGVGFGARLVANRNFATEPELFWGPFMQLGTHLGIGPTWMQIAIDMVTDVPGNLLALGTGGLIGGAAKARSIAKLTTALGSSLTKAKNGGKIAKGISGAQIMDEAERALQFAGSLVGKQDEFMAAAKGGSKSLISLVDEAMATGRVSEDLAPLLGSMQKNRKALATIIDKSDDIRKVKEVPGSAFAQGSFRAQVEAGQATDFLRVPLPYKDGKPSLPTFMRQMVGFSYKDDVYWAPASRSISKGLDRLGLRSLTEHGALPLADDLSVDVALRGRDELKRASGRTINDFLSGKTVSGDGNLNYVAHGLANFDVILGAPTERKFAELGLTVTDEEMLGQYAAHMGKNVEDVSMADDGYKIYAEGQMNRLARARATEDAATQTATNAMITRAAAKASSKPVDEAISAMEIDRALMGGKEAGLRSMLDTFSMESLQWDAVSPGHAIRSRASLGTLMASTVSTSSDDVLKHAYRNVKTRRAITGMIPDIIDQPDAFIFKDGKWLVDPDKAKGFLEKNLEDWARDQPEMLKHVLEDGIKPEVVQLAKMYGDTLSLLGETLYSEQVIRGFLNDYFPRVFTPNKKFYDKMKIRGTSLLSKKYKSLGSDLLDEGDNKLLDAMLADKDLGPRVQKLKAGKMSLQENRRFTDEMAVWLEKNGYGTYKRDGVSVMANYLDAANKAHLMTRMVRDMPKITPHLTLAQLAEDNPKLAEVIKDKDLRGVRRVMLLGSEKEIPVAVRDEFRVVDFPVSGGAADVPLEKVEKRARAEAYRGEAKRQTADRLHGKSKVGEIDVVDKAGNPVKIAREWIERPGSAKIPGNIRQSDVKKIKKEIARIVNERFTSGKAKRTVDSRFQKPAALKYGGKKLYVYKKDYAQLIEPFRLYSKSGTSNAMIRAYDKWSFRMKSAVLLGDVFHYNVLAVGQFLSNPQSILPRLTDESGRLLPGVRSGAFLPAAAGAAGGAAAGSAMGADTEGVVGFSLAGALYGGMIGAATRNARAAGKIALNPDNLDTVRMMGLGGWTGRPDDRAIGAMQTWARALSEKMSQSGAFKFLSHPLDAAAEGLDWWDEQLWGVMHNGSKHFYFQQIWHKELPKLEKSAGYTEKGLKKAYETMLGEGPKGAGAPKVFKQTGEQIPFSNFVEQERHRMQVGLAREINQINNDMFGGQNFAALLENPEIAKNMRRFLLSPDWTSSRLKLASSMLINMSDPQRAALGATLGAGMEMADSGFDLDEVGVPSMGISMGALFGVMGGRWAQRVNKRMVTPGDFQAKEARRLMTSALAGGYIFSELLNKAFTGHWMHENEHGKKLSIQLPGKGANGRANYMRLGKPWLEAFEFAGVVEREKFPIPAVSRISTKLNVPIQAGLRLINNRNIFGPIMVGDEEANEMGMKLMDVALDTVTPIIAQGPKRMAVSAARGELDARTTALSGLRFAGIPVSGGRESVPDMSQFLRGMGTQSFLRQQQASPVPSFGGALR